MILIYLLLPCSSFHLVVIWVLFENVMSLHRLKAAFTGLFEAERVNEWIVTEKLGDANKTKPVVIDIKEADKLVDSQLTEPCIPKLKKKKSRLCERYYGFSFDRLWCFTSTTISEINLASSTTFFSEFTKVNYYMCT
jgi:hypothetical protein